ncbi:Outer-membrane lipoprotein lolB precursor, putative [Ricinus communis]|uniref:Outer-membrane lipoprotein lolB, putative n=1 Tax=Ricinus communis TaxID=3988 RepID=B9TN77_RICCO|nr:Outer-membrane lipoprotein lolB precursor, putative [Ricinus communis]
MIRHLLIAAALSAAVAGCATTGPRSTAAVAPYSDKIELNGRLSINYSHDGKKESSTVNYDWQQDKDNTNITLISPTGQTVAVIKVTPRSATLTQSDKQPQTAPDVDTLTRQILGWTLPVSGLREWLQGHATDSSGKPFVASPANDTVVTRDGWKLEYVDWQDDKAAVPRPKRIDVTRLTLGEAVEDVNIRIVIAASDQ